MATAFVTPLSHDPPCPTCGHSHHWLPCDWCPCTSHDRPGDQEA